MLDDNPQAGTPDSPPETPAGAEVPNGPKSPGFDSNGKFAKGNKLGGRHQGSLDRVTRAMKESYEDFMTAQPDKAKFNPLIILANIAAGFGPDGKPKVNKDGQAVDDPELRSLAAYRLWKMIAPKQIEVSGKDGGAIEVETGNEFAQQLAKSPEERAIAEAIQEAVAKVKKDRAV